MVACYHDEVTFSDPAFPGLVGDRAKAMWRMLCERAQDFELTFSAVEADGERGSAHWDASYTFSKTGRSVRNSIDASFRFADGLIIAHEDHFNLRRWAAQALGLKGMLLGWLPPVQNAIRKESARMLDAYIAKQA